MTNTLSHPQLQLPDAKTPGLPDLGETVMIKTKGTRFTHTGNRFIYVKVIDVDEVAGCFVGEAKIYSEGKYFTTSQWLLPDSIHKRVRFNRK